MCMSVLPTWQPCYKALEGPYVPQTPGFWSHFSYLSHTVGWTTHRESGRDQNAVTWGEKHKFTSRQDTEDEDSTDAYVYMVSIWWQAPAASLLMSNVRNSAWVNAESIPIFLQPGNKQGNIPTWCLHILRLHLLNQFFWGDFTESAFISTLFSTVLNLRLIKGTLMSYLLRTASPSSPTKSRCGPISTEFQFQEKSDPQLVKPSWCLAVRTTYLQRSRLTRNTRCLYDLGYIYHH